MTSTTPTEAQALSRGGDSRIRRSVPSRASRRISQTRTDSPYRWRAAGLEGIRVVLSIPARLTAILAINDAMADLEQTQSDAMAGAKARRIRKRAGVE